MQNILFENVFTDEEIEIIKQTVESNSHLIEIQTNQHQKERGRDELHLNPILDKRIEEKAQTYFDTLGDYKVGPIMWGKYNADHTNPNLPPHKDPRNVILTFDYQLESNVDWPIVIEGVEYQLKDNQAIAFNSRDQFHHRPERTFKPGEYVTMIFFQIKDDNAI